MGRRRKYYTRADMLKSTSCTETDDKDGWESKMVYFYPVMCSLCYERGITSDKVFQRANVTTKESWYYRRGGAPSKELFNKISMSLNITPRQFLKRLNSKTEKIQAMCSGDKLHCPYLTRIEKRGYCPFPRCFNEEG